MTPTQSPAASAAVPVLRAEFPCFGVHDDGSCRCGDPKCTSQGKHPRYHNWLFEDHPIAPADHVGYRTGRVSGIGIIDLDTDKGRDLESCHREWAALFPNGIPRTFAVRTPSGGVHYHFRLPGAGNADALDDFRFTSTVRKLSPHIDTRGEMSLGVIRGKGYTIIDDSPPAPLPPEIVRWMEEYNARKATTGPYQLRPPKVTPPTPGDSAWETALGLLHSVWPDQGARHDARLALGGACLWWWQDVEATVAFVSALDERIGAGNSIERIREPIETAARRMAANQKVAGWGELYACIGFDEGERVRRILGMKDPPMELFRLPEAAPPEADQGKKRRDGHAYTFWVGSLSQQKTRTASASELHHYLMRHPAWNDPTPVLWFDARKLVVRAFNPPVALEAEKAAGWQDTDTEAIRGWLECSVGLTASSEEIWKAVGLVARSRPFDPVVDYLESLHRAPSGDAIRELCDAMGTTEPIECLYVLLFLVGAVARAYEPGIPMRNMLILKGRQQGGKSTWCRALFAPWFREDVPDIKTKDGQGALRGYWGVEIPEFDDWMKYGNSTKKKFLSTLVDTYRPPYGRSEVEVPRGAVFIGTTNAEEFLNDPTGDTRYYPVRVSPEMDVVRLGALRDAVWAQARDIYKAWAATREGERPWHLPKAFVEAAEHQKRAFSEVDPWEDAVRNYLKGKEEVPSAAQVYLEAIANNQPGALVATTSREARRIADILRKLGCTAVKGTGGRRFYQIPPQLKG